MLAFAALHVNLQKEVWLAIKERRVFCVCHKLRKSQPMLVPQATFEDELIGEARAKRHSTTGEAVGIGQRAGAYRTVLTHFSQRYAKLPVIDDSFRVSGQPHRVMHH